MPDHKQESAAAILAARQPWDAMVKAIYQCHLDHKWPKRTFGEDIALLHSELSEALEEYRSGHRPQEIYFTKDAQGHLKPEGIPIELADCFIRLALLAEQSGIDLWNAIQVKMDYNNGRPARHGGKLL